MKHAISASLGLALALVAMPASARQTALLVLPKQREDIRVAGVLRHALQDAFHLVDERYDKNPDITEEEVLADINASLGTADDDDGVATSLMTAKQRLRQAAQYYDVLDLDNALKKLNTALNLLESNAAYLVDFSLVADILMLRGAVYTLQNQTDLAQRDFESAVDIHPAVEPNPRVFNPSMRALFANATAKVAQRPSSRLVVQSVPAGCEVYLDDHFVGITPLQTNSIPEGYHFVRVQKDSYLPAGKSLYIDATDEAHLQFKLRNHPGQSKLQKRLVAVWQSLAPGNPSAEGQAFWRESSAIVQLGELLKAETVVLVVAHQETNTIALQWMSFDTRGHKTIRISGKLLQPKSIDVLTPDNLRWLSDALARLRPGLLLKAGQTPSNQDSKASLCLDGQVRCQTLKNAVVYSHYAVGSALLVSGIGLWVKSSQSYQAYLTTSQLSANSGELQQRGKTQALVGDITFFSGLGMVSLAAGLQLFWHPKPANPFLDKFTTLQWQPTAYGSIWLAQWRY